MNLVMSRGEKFSGDFTAMIGILILTLEGRFCRSSSKEYLTIQFVPHRQHTTSPLKNPIG
jgi:hypothetical protein